MSAAEWKAPGGHERTSAAIEQFKAAFPKNELGTADFDGHRGYHARKIAEGQVMGEYKQEVTKKIVLGAIGLVFTVLGFVAGPALMRWLQ